MTSPDLHGKAVVVGAERLGLGESPTWDTRRQLLCVIDHEDNCLIELTADGDRVRSITFESQIGSFALRETGGYIVATTDHVLLLAPDLSVDLATPGAPEGTRFNDGKASPLGDFWVGTVGLHEERGIGTVVKIGARGNDREILLAGVHLSNGLDWSGSDFLHVDSNAGTVMRYDTSHLGSPTSGRPLVVEKDYLPDGLCADADGNLWVAFWDGGCVRKYSAAGIVERTVDLPVARPTSCVLGGPQLKTLYITSAKRGDTSPLAGSIFRVEVPVPGKPPYTFAG